MDISNVPGDHPKEYYYFPAVGGKKIFYKRTAHGHKLIAERNIPSEFIDRIRCFNCYTDTDWLGEKRKMEIRIEELNKQFMEDVNAKDDPINIRILNAQIEAYRILIRSYEERNNECAEERYKEEMRTNGGFKNYFKQKYEKYYEQYEQYKDYSFSDVDSLKYNTLIKLKIIDSYDTLLVDAKRKYRRWLVSNHPDKGGTNIDLCAIVIKEFKIFEYNKTKM